MDPLPLSIRDPVRFRLESLHNLACGVVLRTMRRGIKGQITPQKAPSVGLALKAALATLDRTAPLVVAQQQILNMNGPVILAWKEAPGTSSSRALPSAASSSSSDASPSSSAIEDSERPFWQ